MHKRIKFLLSVALIALLVLTMTPLAYASEPLVNVNINTSGGSGQIVQNMGMADEAIKKYGITGNYARGTKFILTAQETSCEFLYWKDANSNRIISRNKTYTAIAGTDISISAVFRSPSTTKKLVMFQNSNGEILSSSTYSAGKSVTVPSNPYIHGYTFNSWTLNGVAQSISNNMINVDDLSGDSVYVASHTPKPKLYDVNVSGGSGSGRFLYNTKVVVNLDESLIPEGKVFAYWSNGNDILSYDTTYTFYVGTDTNISAIYEDATLTQKFPSLSIVVADTNTSTNKIAFISERSLPLDYEFVETGILVHTNANFDLSTSGISKAKALSQAPSGQFCVTKKSISVGNTWYAKAYMIYIKDGVSNILYSNTVNATMN